jgi:long-subunit acyl-CoA synthetase (AMP-forming)
VKRTPDAPALGWRPIIDGEAKDYQFMTYREFGDAVSKGGAALKALGVAPGDSVGVYGANSPEALMATKAADWCGGRCVPLYDSFGPDAVSFIVQHSGIKVIFVASNKVAELEKVLSELKGDVRQVVAWSSSSGVTLDQSQSSLKVRVPSRHSILTLWKPAASVQNWTHSPFR